MGNGNDLISRADAIEAVCTEECGITAERCKDLTLGRYCKTHNRLSALPSADAKGRVISVEKLKRMKFVVKGDKTEEAYRKGWNGAIKCVIDNVSSSAEAVQGWITGKPTENGQYMVTLEAWGHHYIEVFHYGKPLMPNRFGENVCWYRCDDEYGDVVYDDKDILAWMPLPTRYKGGDDE